MRILVTGSRDWADEESLKDAIYSARFMGGFIFNTVIVHGACYPPIDPKTGKRPLRSADWLAERAAKEFGFKSEPTPADWNTHGKKAGSLRNQEMIDKGADICLAFPLPQSKGTWDCVRRAKAAGIRVVVIEPKVAL